MESIQYKFEIQIGYGYLFKKKCFPYLKWQWFLGCGGGGGKPPVSVMFNPGYARDIYSYIPINPIIIL